MVAVLVVVNAFDFASDAAGMSLREGSIDLGRFDAQAIAWLLWTPFLPAFVFIAEALRPDRRSWPVVITGHTLAAVLTGLLHPAASVGAIYALVPRPFPIDAYFRGVVNQTFVMDALLYLGCIGAYLAQYYLQRTHRDRLAAARAEVRATRLEGLMTDARLAALRRELRPHFLHNALQSVSGLVREGRPERAIRMLDELDSLFRRSLASSDGRPVPLADELRVVDSYLAIELVRFEDRMRVEYDVPHEARGLEVPPLILQPLVENAVRHGVARSAGPVTIHVVVQLDGSVLRLVVENDGPPLASAVRSDGVGLENTAARLRLLYGDEASVDLRAREGGGAVSEVELPAGRPSGRSG